MTVRRLRDLLVRYWWMFALAMAAAIGGMVAQAERAPSTHVSTSIVQVVGPFAGDDTYRDFNRDYAERSMRTYIALSDTEPIRSEVRDALGLDELPSIVAAPIPGTELVEITVEADDGDTATAVADEMAAVFVEMRWNQTDDGEFASASDPQPSIVLVEPADAAVEDHPSVPVAAALGAGLGALGGLLLVLVVARRDPRVRSRREAEELTGLPVVFETTSAITGTTAAAAARWLASTDDPGGDGGGRVVLVTTPTTDRGTDDLAKRVTAICTRLGFRVLLLDPSLPESFDQLLGGEELERLRDDYDLIVIDAPDYLGSEVAPLFKMLADESVVGVNLHETRRDELVRTTHELARPSAVRTVLAVSAGRD